MLITIHNEHLSLTVDTLGAQMMSIRLADGCEYLWQGSPEYWGDRVSFDWTALEQHLYFPR